MAVYEVHRKDKRNIGDYYCNPSRYFDLPIKDTKDIFDSWLPNKNDTLIIGGGGLIRKTFIKKLIKYKNTGAKLIFWGIGHNFNETRENLWWPEWLTSSALYSVRDYLKMECYVPCVSCMHPAFDTSYEAKISQVTYIHAHRNRNTDFTKVYGSNLMTNNQQDFNKVINFLGLGKTVVTDSYHGAYWAMLLGRNVKVLNWTSKFSNFEHTPAYIHSLLEPKVLSPNNYKEDFNQYLEKCRNLNKEFYKKVIAELGN